MTQDLAMSNAACDPKLLTLLVCPVTKTRLSYDVDANVGGKIAQLGSRLIDGVARRLADEFFARFQARVEGPLPVEPVAEAEPVEEKKKGWFKRLIGA